MFLMAWIWCTMIFRIRDSSCFDGHSCQQSLHKIAQILFDRHCQIWGFSNAFIHKVRLICCLSFYWTPFCNCATQSFNSFKARTLKDSLPCLHSTTQQSINQPRGQWTHQNCQTYADGVIPRSVIQSVHLSEWTPWKPPWFQSALLWQLAVFNVHRLEIKTWS
jgi:hypothetical protein